MEANLEKKSREKFQMKTLVKIDNHGQFVSSQVFGMFRSKIFTDCTISDGGECVQAHRIVLAAASPYLREMLVCADSSQSHPIMMFNEISFNDVCNVLSFIYTGVVTVGFDEIVHFTNVAKRLKLKGIEGFGIDLKKIVPSSEEKNSSSLPTSLKNIRELRRKSKRSPKTELFSSPESFDESSESDNFPIQRQRIRKKRESGTSAARVPCMFCPNKYNNMNTLKNHQRYCYYNPNRSISRCPICKIEVKPGSMTYHKRNSHEYVSVANHKAKQV